MSVAAQVRSPGVLEGVARSTSHHDADGNLPTNGVWSYAWDAENRLVAAYSNSLCVVSNAYDHASRRVLKVTPDSTHAYLYDGWNLVAEYTHTPTPPNSHTNYYVWGKDLSGTPQGAGGVGGLLAVCLDGAWNFPFYDHNGNVTAYVDESGYLVAEYLYDAFGNTIAQSRPLADSFPHRFSTKYFDPETGLFYYGYRFYAPEPGRWMNRDPSGENSGLNLYGFCGNSMNGWDYLGLWVLNLISNNSTIDDALIWKAVSMLNGSTTVSDISSINELFWQLEQQVFLHGVEPITELNLSGHGVGGGSGISFSSGDPFDLLKLTDVQKVRLKGLLAPYARIRLWSCDSAKSTMQCQGLAAFAIELGVSVEGKSGDVSSGPDIMGPLVDRAEKVVAYFMKTDDVPEWREFKPIPSISAPSKKGPPVKKVKVKEMQDVK